MSTLQKYLLPFAVVCGLATTPLAAYDPPSTQMHASEVEIEESEQYAFFGVGVGYSNSFVEKSLVELRMGMQNSVWRTMFSYEDNFDMYQGLMIEVDRTIVAGLMAGRGRIYLGASGGWVMFAGDRLENDLSVEWEDYGYAYGFNGGFMYYLSDRADLSIGYRYLKVQDICGAEACLKDTIQGIEVALHYFF